MVLFGRRGLGLVVAIVDVSWDGLSLMILLRGIVESVGVSGPGWGVSLLFTAEGRVLRVVLLFLRMTFGSLESKED